MKWQFFTRWSLRVALLSLIAIVGGFVWLIASESGTRVSITYISGIVPGFSMRHDSGTLIGPLQLRNIVFKNKSLRVEIDHLQLDWSPPCLVLGEVCLRDLRIGTLRFMSTAPNAAAGSKPKPMWPAVSLPLSLDLSRLEIGALEVVRNGKTTLLTQLQIAGYWQDDEIRVDHLLIGMSGWEARATGTLYARDDWPLQASLQFITPRQGDLVFGIKGTGNGSLNDAHLLLETEGLLVSRLDGHLQPLQAGMPFSATLTAAEQSIPPRGNPATTAHLRDITLHAKGLVLGQIFLEGNAELDTPWTPPLPATLREASGTWRGIERAELRIDEPRVLASIISDYQWLGGQHFRATVELGRLDLALVNPALPSRLHGTLQVDGSIEKTGTMIDIAVDALDGTLREWPLAAAGKMRWQEAQWHFDPLQIQLGDNTALLTGTLGSEWNASAALTLNDLHVLQPAFAGTAQGHADIRGASTDPDFSFALNAQDLLLPAVAMPAPLARTLRLPAADWDINGRATLRNVSIDSAQTRDDNALAMHASGDVNWQHGLRWDLATDIAALSLHDVLPELNGEVAGHFNTRGTLGESAGSPLQDLHIATQLQGEALDLPLTLEADIDHAPSQSVIRSLHIRHGENDLAVAGKLEGDTLALQLDLKAPELADTLSDASGHVLFSSTLSGTRTRPTIKTRAHAENLNWRDTHVAGLDLAADIHDGAFASSSFTLDATQLLHGEQAFEKLSVQADGNRQQHTLVIAVESAPIELQLAAHGSLLGDHRDNLIWNGYLADSTLALDDWRWHNPDSPALTISSTTLRIAPHCWTDNSARACVTHPAEIGAGGQIATEFFHLPMEKLFAGTLPIDTRVEGRIGGMLSAAWQQGALSELNTDIRNADPLRLSLAGDAEQRELGVIERFLIQAGLDAQGGNFIATLQGENVGKLESRATLGASAGNPLSERTLNASVNISQVKLALLEAFTYQMHDIDGSIDGTIAIDGTPAQPKVAGTMHLVDGRAAFTRLPLNLVDINIGSQFDGEHISFAGSLRTPESSGQAQISGDIRRIRQQWQAQGKLTGDNLVIAALPEYQFTLAPNLTLNANAGQLGINGRVGVPAGRIELKSLPAQSVQRSRDVMIIREDQIISDTGFGFRQQIDVDFALGDDVRFRAFGGEGRLSGGLRVRSTPELPLFVNGELHVHEGKYAAFGQSLNLKQADIIFNGPADQPLIDALASRSFDDGAVREVGLRLTGSLRAPETTLWSTPTLPDEEALSWLATGRPLADGPINLRGEAAQAALSLGVAQGSALLTAAGQEIGLNDVQLATGGDGDDAEVQIGTNVNERIFVGYNRRVFTGDESVLLRLHLTRRLMLEALSGLDSALDLFYTFEF